jgi:hypothetical protein
MTYYCDKYPDWQANIRAIALGMQRLRLVEETGIISRGEQYTGFKALPGAIPMGPATMTLEEAARELAALSGVPERWQPMMTAVDTFRTLYRSLAARLHPDAGGRIEQWHRFQQAAELLKKHHKIA